MTDYQIIKFAKLKICETQEVWLVVSPHNPLKKKASLLADHHRLRLVQEAIEDNPRLKASDIEFKLPQPNYTINTLLYLGEKYPNHAFSIILGEDNLRSFSKWKNHDQILKNHRLLIYPRIKTHGEIETQKNDYDAFLKHPHVFLISNVPMMAVSASFIRSQIHNGKSVDYLLTPPVARYIKEMHFYE